MLKLASWNVNSLKVRLDQVLDWFEVNDIDILALQETKVIDDDFPQEVFRSRGYQVCFSGQKTYNGVAIISRNSQEQIVCDIPDYIDSQRRVLCATIGDLRVINLYIPNGAAVDSDKYQYKLEWLEKITAYIEKELKMHSKVAVVGDFNIAPEDCDVHDPSEWIGSVLVSPQEREAFQAMIKLGLKDSFRLFPQAEKIYSWWDYRAASFRRDRGLRIDHILLSDKLAVQCLSSKVDVMPRKHERPSDHAPVFVELDI